MAGQVVVSIVGDVTKLRQALKQSGDDFDSFGSRMESVGKKISKVGAGLSIGITAPLTLLGKASFNAASDLNESLSKVGVVFGDWAEDIEHFADTAAKGLGISRREALESAGTFGNLFKALGLSSEATTEMSIAMVKLASDLASFNNVADVNEVLLALRAGLVGEAEPLRRFGVSLSAARVEAEALGAGLVKPIANATEIATKQIAVEKATVAAARAMKEHGASSLDARDATAALAKAEEDLAEATRGKVPELTAAQKAQASFNVIMKDTALAQGDFARTSGGAAGQMKIMKAQFQDLEAQLGQALIPIFIKVADALSKLSSWFMTLSPQTQEIIVYVGLLAAAMGPLTTAIGGVSTALWFLIANPYVALAAATVALAILIIKNWDSIKAAAIDAVNVVIDQINALIHAYNSIPFLPNVGDVGYVGEDAPPPLGGLYGTGPGGFNPYLPDSPYNPYPGGPNDPLHRLGPVAPIRKRARGGHVGAGQSYIVGEVGPELLTMGAQSGYVTPNGGWGGGTIVIPVSVGGREISRIVVEDINSPGGPKISQRAMSR